MKCTIPEISWHNRDPILSIDIQPVYNEEFYRLASGGTDCHVLIWYLKVRKNGAVDVDVVSDLNRHQRAVNAVRWSPSGQHLATGDDDANIILWNLKTDNIPLLEGDTTDKETWLVHKILRGHKEDVYDICWSPDGLKLLSGSIDNTAILWDFSKGLNECILTDHKGFVQGVTWDPKGQYVATLCSDRVCRVFDNTGKQVKSRCYKGLLPLPESHVLFNKEVKYFHDDTFKSYFRRLSFSPDGNLLIAPSGCIESDEFTEIRHTTLVFTLDSLTQPVALLPNPKQETIAVRCCPILFELYTEGSSPIIDLPYRMIIAVATDSDVVLYDTQQLVPFAHLQKIHYTRITDLTWSSDGLLLIASSTDGYCTLITFESNELGIQYVKEESEAEESFMDVSGCEELDKTEKSIKKNMEKEEIKEIKIKKPNLLEQWAIRKPKADDNIHSSSNKEKITNNLAVSGESDLIEISDDDSNDNSKENKETLQCQDSQTVKKNGVIDINDTDCKSEKHSSIPMDIKKSPKSNDIVIQNDGKENVSSKKIKGKQNMKIEDFCNILPSNSQKGTEKPSTSGASTSKTTTVLPIKTATPKGPRRIAFVTLSSPKRKKKM